MEFEEYSDEELLERGREAVKLEQWPKATSLLAAYVGRFASRGETVPASGLASYALCLGHGRELRRGLDLCRKAQNADPRNPHVYWCLSQLQLLAKSRKEAIDTIERGLRASPDNFLLLRMRKRLGVRQPPPIPFLDRRNALNISLGRLIYKLKGNAALVLPGLV